jgi:alpha-amylase
VVRVGPNEAVVGRDGRATIDGHTFDLSIETTIQLSGGRLDPGIRWSTVVVNRSEETLVARLGVEWATTMLGGGGNPQAWWELAGVRGAHDGSGAAVGVERIAQGNTWLGVEIETRVEPAADAWYAPIETVSNSEAGFERVYQGSALLLSWPVSLPPWGRLRATIAHRATIETVPENPSARGLRTTG